MKSEFEKMRSGELADFSDPEIQESFRHSRKLCVKLQTMTIHDDDYREVIGQLIPDLPASSTVCPPIQCDHGSSVVIAENVFINYNAMCIGGGYIRIGRHTLIGPNCQFYTPNHPMDYVERREEKEYAYPITIGEDCWFGGNVTLLPGVTIGNRCIVAAGSVVTKDVPDDCMVAGNPATIKKRLNQ
ncbi:MAG: maltose acetyltransferase [Bacteroidia bacterium 44-10]|nr:MAG: maltose acetyltransferase [Bacteroidia bacterium 44-10]